MAVLTIAIRTASHFLLAHSHDRRFLQYGYMLACPDPSSRRHRGKVRV